VQAAAIDSPACEGQAQLVMELDSSGAVMSRFVYASKTIEN
jgi:hypothetical protein